MCTAQRPGRRSRLQGTQGQGKTGARYLDGTIRHQLSFGAQCALLYMHKLKGHAGRGVMDLQDRQNEAQCKFWGYAVALWLSW